MHALRQRVNPSYDGASDPKPEPNKSHAKQGSSLAVTRSANDTNFVAPLPSASSSLPSYYKPLLVCFTLLAVATRFYSLYFPSAIVFDEVLQGEQLNSLLQREFYFCPGNPPLSTLLFGLVAKLIHYDGEFGFSRIGKEFLSAASLSEGGLFYLGLRAVSAVFGVMTVALFYDMLVRIGLGPKSITVATLALIFDNALIAISKFMFPDAMYLFFSLLTVYCFIRSLRSSSSGWLFLTGFAIGCAQSTKFAGACYWLMIVGYAFFIDRKRSTRKAKLMSLVALPVLFYLAVMYAYFSISSYSGPGDQYMSPQFRSSLVQTFQSKAKFSPVQHGARIRLLNSVEPVLLHSHAHYYPREHLLDGKISSSGQQVSGYPASIGDRVKDPLDYWRMYIAPKTESLPFDPETGHLLLDNFDFMAAVHANGTSGPEAHGRQRGGIQLGQTVLLQHEVTAKFLTTHDVASALTKTNMEVTAFGLPDLDSHYNDTLWRVVSASDIPRPGALVSGTPIRLVHVATGVRLTNHQQNYPSEWGFSQREINGDRSAVSASSEWRILSEDEPLSEEKREAGAGSMGFFAKLFEYHAVLLRAIGQALSTPNVHRYQSSPFSWPLLLRGVSMWDHSHNMQQIYLIGNPFCWALALIGLVLYAVLLKRTRRQQAAVREGGIFVLAWATHYLPYFFMGHFVFLHNYLPSYVMSVAALAVLLDRYYASEKGATWTVTLASMAVVLLIVFTCYHFSPLTYGTSMSRSEVLARKWSPEWNLLLGQAR